MYRTNRLRPTPHSDRYGLELKQQESPSSNQSRRSSKNQIKACNKGRPAADSQAANEARLELEDEGSPQKQLIRCKEGTVKDRSGSNADPGSNLKAQTTQGNSHLRRGSQLREMTNIEQRLCILTHSRIMAIDRYPFARCVARTVLGSRHTQIDTRPELKQRGFTE